MIWHQKFTTEDLANFRNKNMGEYLGIEFLEVGDDYLKAKMPVDHRTTQPFGILHGGASCVLAESLGSVAAWMAIDAEKYRAVGLEINANHIRAVTQGNVIGTATPLHLGRRTHVWSIDIEEEATGKRVCISRLTVAIIDQGTLSTQKTAIHLKS